VVHPIPSGTGTAPQSQIIGVPRAVSDHPAVPGFAFTTRRSPTRSRSAMCSALNAHDSSASDPEAEPLCAPWSDPLSTAGRRAVGRSPTIPRVSPRVAAQRTDQPRREDPAVAFCAPATRWDPVGLTRVLPISSPTGEPSTQHTFFRVGRGSYGGGDVQTSYIDHNQTTRAPRPATRMSVSKAAGIGWDGPEAEPHGPLSKDVAVGREISTPGEALPL